MKTAFRSCLLVTTTLAVGLSWPAVASASIPELDVTFYGRVLHRGGGEDYLMTTGDLSWTVAPEGAPDQPQFEGRTDLQPLNGGVYSYTIRIPQHLLLPALRTPESEGLLITQWSASSPFRNTTISLNGRRLRLVDPTGVGFDVSPTDRGLVRRLDLVYEGNLPDTDGDTLPDWWEDKYDTGRNQSNATADDDGDGVSNLAEYLAGTNPTHEDLQPLLAAEILVSMPTGGAAILVFNPQDRDSAPEALSYTLGALPAGLTVQRSDTAEAVTQFTQADIAAGLIEVRHTLGDTPGQFTLDLTLRDETPEHAAASSQLVVAVGAPALLWAGWGLPAEARPVNVPAVQDASRMGQGWTFRTPSGWQTLDSPPADAPASREIARLFLDSPGTDALLGSQEDDVLIPGSGDVVRGDRGADRVLFAQATGTVEWRDFSPAEGDVIDLRGLITPGTSTQFADYVKLDGQRLRVSARGTGFAASDLTIELPGAELPASVEDLWDAGYLETGPLVPGTTLFVTTSGSAAEENRQVATIKLRRRGDASQALSVPVSWSGTALPGYDYLTLPSSVQFATGQKEIELTISPLEDGLREPTETIQMLVGEDPQWTLADGSRSAVVELADLPSRVWLEVVERVGYQNEQFPAQILVRRSGPVGDSLTVRLKSSGLASPALDYPRLASTVSFYPGQTVVQIDVLPSASAVLTNGLEDVVVDVEADTEYAFGPTPKAQVWLIQRAFGASAWLLGQGVTEQKSTLWASDDDGDGLTGLEEFAFGGSLAGQDAKTILPRIELAGAGQILVSYDRWPDATELTYQLETSDDLSTWLPVASSEIVGEEIAPRETGMQNIALTVQVKANEALGFYRLRVNITQ